METGHNPSYVEVPEACQNTSELISPIQLAGGEDKEEDQDLEPRGNKAQLFAEQPDTGLCQHFPI